MWKDSIRNVVRIVGFYARHSATVISNQNQNPHTYLFSFTYNITTETR